MTFGIIGTSLIADNFFDACKSLNVKVKMVYSRKKDTGNQFALKHNINFVTTDLFELANDPDIDTIYIASPNSCHYEQALFMINNKKNVLIEKPITSNVIELNKLITAAKENNIIFLEAMRPLFDPQTDIIKKYIPLIGNIIEANISFCKYSSRYDSFKNGIILNAFNPDLSNASIMDIGVYCISVCHFLFGKETSQSSKSSFLYNNFESNGVLELNYDKFTVNIEYSKIYNKDDYSYIKGTTGSIYFDHVNSMNNVIINNYKNNATIQYVSNVANNMIYEIEKINKLIDEKSVDNDYIKYSLWEMMTIDEARKQNNIVFSSD